MKTSFAVASVCLLLPALAAAKAYRDADWNYDNAAWETVSDDYALCGTGKTQSPINVKNDRARATCDRPTITQYESRLNFSAKENNYALECLNTETPCSTIQYGNLTYSMLQMHAHSPSEYTLNSQSFALAIHFVHASVAGDLAVLGVFYKLGKYNEEIGKFLEAAKDAKEVTIDLSKMFYEHATLCNFKGSLTTPPCSEGVQWFLSWGVMEISVDQMMDFRKLVGDVKTNRPLQPANGRDISCVH